MPEFEQMVLAHKLLDFKNRKNYFYEETILEDMNLNSKQVEKYYKVH